MTNTLHSSPWVCLREQRACWQHLDLQEERSEAIPVHFLAEDGEHAGVKAGALLQVLEETLVDLERLCAVLPRHLPLWG